ncbi:MAG: hypothetical protein BMS9Abin12_2126 [Acidimicrobiia bacterium]|nr:MAG: hypothetical protein BMS9Abin12_2126 [Acidimicrobiia bacterium]
MLLESRELGSLPVVATAGLHRVEIPVSLETVPAGLVRATIRSEDGRVSPCRVYLSDEFGAPWPADVIPRRDRHGAVYFHTSGSFATPFCGSVLSGGYGVYVELSTTSIAGVASSALLLIVLVYFMAQVLLYGAEVIKVQSRRRAVSIPLDETSTHHI